MKIILVQSKFLVKFCLIFFVTNISNIDRHSSIHQNKASWWIVCVRYLQISQILIITSGENYWILNWFWSSPKQSPHKKGSTDKRGKLNCFMFKVRWCLLHSPHSTYVLTVLPLNSRFLGPAIFVNLKSVNSYFKIFLPIHCICSIHVQKALD